MNRQLKSVIWLILGFILFFLTIAFAGFYYLPINYLHGNVQFFQNFGNWDAGRFLSLAQGGYTDRSQYAFFPAFPLLVRFFVFLSHLDFLTVGIILNFIFIFPSLIILTKLVRLDFSDKVAFKSLLYLLIFPASFYLLLPYSEGLFFLSTILAFYFYRKEKYIWAAIFAGLASITRLAGLALILALWVEILVKKNRKAYVLFLAPVFFVAFCVYLKIQTGDPFYFLVAERDWQRILSIPGISLVNSLLNIFTPGFLQNNLNTLANFILCALGLGLGLRAIRKLRISYWVYALLSLGLPLISSNLDSMPRFILPIFPIFICLALIETEIKSGLGKAVIYLYKALSVLVLVVYLISFFNGYGVS